jgi:hypothetical protein
MLDLPKLFQDVFRYEKDEIVAILIDLPTAEAPDNPAWAERRAMAAEWLAAWRELGLTTLPLLTYPATGANGANLPQSFTTTDGASTSATAVFGRVNILLAMTRFSATGPLTRVLEAFPQLRVASMPGVTQAMQDTALAVDHAKLRVLAHRLVPLLNAADKAEVTFSTGHEVTFDLRYRQRAEADAGECFAGAASRLINLPTGETFIVPYEGELPGAPSLTAGEIPVMSQDGKPAQTGELVVFNVTAGKIIHVSGHPGEAAAWNAYFATDEARRHVAELGLGCNEAAVVRGIVLEDEKAGFHWAYGRNEYFADGHNDAGKFTSPLHIVHQDIVYAPASPITVRELWLVDRDGSKALLMVDGRYV